MSRIEKRFAKLKQAGRKAFVAFTMAGDPDAETSLAVCRELARHADILEIGMPFSDPMADGPTIQAAGLRALDAGMTLRGTLDLVRRFRDADAETPVVLMGYLNPILRFGANDFCTACADAGADGLIIVDMPPEEAVELADPMSMSGLTAIRLVAPTTNDDRLGDVLTGAGGFVYFVSITGITGTANADPDAVKRQVARIKEKTPLPVLAGFGVRSPADVRALADGVDGVVVGSALVDIIARADGNPVSAIGDLALDLRTALDGGSPS